MIAHRVIRKMIAVFEEEIASDEHKSMGRLAGSLVLELLHSEPDGRGNMLSQAYNELEGRQNRTQMSHCTDIVVRLYQSRTSGRSRPTTSALKEALAEAMELQARNLNQSIDEKSFVLANYSRLGKGYTYSDMYSEIYPDTRKSQKEVDAFRKRAKRILEENGQIKPALSRGRPKK